MFRDYDWQYCFLEMFARFQSWGEYCDCDEESDEAPDTIFCEIAVQWCEKGGLYDPLLGFELTIFSRHPQAYSVGRATHVQPGAKMVIGCLVKKPASCKNDL